MPRTKVEELRPVYAIDGEERVLVDDAVRRIKADALSDKSRDFNFDAFAGKEASLSKIVDAAKTLPVFAQRRLVLVQEANKLNLEGSESLIEYLKGPSPTTVLVFVADKFDARTKVYKAFQKAGAVLRFGRPKAKEMAGAIRARAKAMDIAIDERAIVALEQSMGTDLSQASQALEVLSLYVDPSGAKPISALDVEQMVSKVSEASVFALTDDIGNQNLSRVLEHLRSLLQISREPPLRLLSMIARHYRNLIKARAGLDAGLGRADIEKAVGIPPYFVGSLLAQARRQPLARLVQGLSAISATDRSLKGGPLVPERALERLVFQLVRSSSSS